MAVRITRSKIEYTDYALNYARGCEHNCTYCYARTLATRFPRLMPSSGHWPEIDALDSVVLSPPPIGGKNRLMLCSMTDPFQPGLAGLSTEVVSLLHSRVPAWKLLVVTKSEEVVKLASVVSPRDSLEILMTITHHDDSVAAEYEPGASAISDRIRAISYLHGRGFKICLNIEPQLPGLDIENIYTRTHGHVGRIIVGQLNGVAGPDNHRADEVANARWLRDNATIPVYVKNDLRKRMR